MDYSIKICGEAGQGIQTIGDTLAKVFSRCGYHVFAHQDYESRIRGGNNFYQIRFSDKPVTASKEHIDIIVAFDGASVTLHGSGLSEGGLLVFDSSAPEPKYDDARFLGIPFSDLALQHGGKIMANVVATGSVLGMLGIKPDIFDGIIRDSFGRKGEEVIQANLNAARAGHDFALRNCPRCSFNPSPSGSPMALISGIAGIALGAIASGCKFYAAYPMTPSTGIMNYLAGKAQEYGIIVEQAEDEIAAINMAIGASFAGVRAMTGTAGGGFALMVEGLSLSGMTETPVVIALGQRPAPATGLPTRTEQGDLLFAVHAAHGEFPRVIFAPGSPEQALYLMNKAFDLSEKYQIPALVLFDQYLADSVWTYEGLNIAKPGYYDYRLRGAALKQFRKYKRHAFTENGVSAFGIPGDSTNLVVTDSDEHDEDGHIIEDAETRVKMVQKRLLKKLPVLRKEIEPPLRYGSSNPDIVLVCWGSLYGIVREVIDFLRREEKVAMLHFSQLYPFPSTDGFDYLSFLNGSKLAICIEQNASGQFARLFRTETGYQFAGMIGKYDGRPFTVENLIGEVYARCGRL